MFADTCAWRDVDASLIARQAALVASRGGGAGGSIVLLATTHAHVDFAANLIESLSRVGVMNYALLTPDEPMLATCGARGWVCALAPMEVGVNARVTADGGGDREAMSQHSPLYNRFTWERLRWVECVLLMAVSVLFLDTDSVALPGFARAVARLFPVVAGLDGATARHLPESLSVSCDNLVGPQTNPALSAWRADDGGAALALLRAWRSLEPSGPAGPVYGDMRGARLTMASPFTDCG